MSEFEYVNKAWANCLIYSWFARNSEMDDAVGNGNVHVESNDDGVTNLAECWKYFTWVRLGKDGIGRARCNGCKKVYKCGGKLHGTSSLNRHMLICNQINYGDVGKICWCGFRHWIQVLFLDLSIYLWFNC